MPEFGLPEIGGFAFGVVLAAVLEFLKIFGLVDEDSAPWAAVILGAFWAGFHVAFTYWPQYEVWFVMLLQLVLGFASLPLGAKAGYKGIVQPLAKNRWNKKS